ncbi:MAG TPA: DUF72 domain-containing protein [Chitinophagaceae bacterium]|nr:DUF72 domain-containing protein [Chitinophagaceae bacterium]
MKWHIGCSGYHYRDWKEIFYPAGLPQKKWFEYYNSCFDTLELNVTFYRFPQLKFLQNWYAISSPGFIFTVKAPRLITHYKKFNNCEDLLKNFYDTVITGLNDKLGTVLFQFPPSFVYSSERLELIVKNLSAEIKNVLEFRHTSWWTKDVFKQLQKKKIIFSGISHPKLPDKVIINNKIAYYRFHGVPDLYYSAYSHDQLQTIADALLNDKTVKEAYIYFNNTATIGAIENAVWFKEYINGKR